MIWGIPITEIPLKWGIFYGGMNKHLFTSDRALGTSRNDSLGKARLLIGEWIRGYISRTTESAKSAESQKLAPQHRGLMMRAEFPELSAWFMGSSTGQVVSRSSTILTVYVCLGKTRLCDSCKFLGLSETCEFPTRVSVNLTFWDRIFLFRGNGYTATR